MSEPERRVQVERLVGGGRGLAHVDNETWFVSGALPDEVVRARPLRRRAGVVEAQTTSLLGEPHPARCLDPCPHSHECGGCDWPHVLPSAGAPLKAAVAAGGARPHPPIAEALATAPVQPSPLAYRLRATFHWDPAGKTLGFYARRSHTVVDVVHCRLLSPTLARLRQRLERALAERRCPAVDVICLENLDGSTAVAALRTQGRSSTPLPRRALPTADEVGHQPLIGLHRLVRNGSCSAGWGETALRIEVAGGLVTPVSAFFQVNRHLLPWLAQRLHRLAAGASGPLFDLHAGVGFLAAAVVGDSTRPAYLAEPYSPAASAAATNIPHATVATVNASSAVAAWTERPRDALVLVDPPRSGLGRELTDQLAAWRPKRLISLGCDPAPWTRDHARLLDAGYQLASLELVDLFPSTHHVEILAVLEPQ